MYTAAEKRDAIEREIAIRRRGYPGRVSRRRMTQQQADYQIAIFEEIRADYTKLANDEAFT